MSAAWTTQITASDSFEERLRKFALIAPRPGIVVTVHEPGKPDVSYDGIMDSCEGALLVCTGWTDGIENTITVDLGVLLYNDPAVRITIEDYPPTKDRSN